MKANIKAYEEARVVAGLSWLPDNFLEVRESSGVSVYFIHILFFVLAVFHTPIKSTLTELNILMHVTMAKVHATTTKLFSCLNVGGHLLMINML